MIPNVATKSAIEPPLRPAVVTRLVAAAVCLLAAVPGISGPSALTAETSPEELRVPIAIIDSVEILAENVFDLSDPNYNNFLFRLANKTHLTTRHAVIRRELLLGKGDPFDSALVNESIRNLRQLPFLLKTHIYLKTGTGGEHIMVVNTSDKWTTVGGLSIHRSGGRTDFQFGLEENNLLGRGIFLSSDFFVLEDDRNFFQTQLGDNRFLGNSFSVNIFYSDSPRSGNLSLTLARPYYSLRQRWGGEISYSLLKSRFDYYHSELLVAQEKLRSYRSRYQFSYRVGPDDIKYHFTPRYEYIDLRSRGRKVYDPAAVDDLPPVAKDSLIHRLQVTLRVQQIRYRVYQKLNRFHKSEDVNLGWDARGSAGWDFGPGFDRRLQWYAAFWPQYTAAVGVHLLITGAYAEYWRARGDGFTRRVNLYFIWYMQYHANHTLAFRADYLSYRLPDPSLTLYLDEDNGLRGYPAFILNGEERVVINIENRFFSDWEILSVGIGGAVFADIGNIWARDGDAAVRDLEPSFGAGLRLGVSRSTQAEVVRIDVAFAPRRDRWQISMGTGQFF